MISGLDNGGYTRYNKWLPYFKQEIKESRSEASMAPCLLVESHSIYKKEEEDKQTCEKGVVDNSFKRPGWLISSEQYSLVQFNVNGDKSHYLLWKFDIKLNI